MQSQRQSPSSASVASAHQPAWLPFMIKGQKAQCSPLHALQMETFEPVGEQPAHSGLTIHHLSLIERYITITITVTITITMTMTITIITTSGAIYLSPEPLLLLLSLVSSLPLFLQAPQRSPHKQVTVTDQRHKHGSVFGIDLGFSQPSTQLQFSCGPFLHFQWC